MNDRPREELISAYIDGELSSDERARVERWLAEDPRLRQLYDELRGLGDAMRSLERHTLEYDVAPVVVGRAERAVLSGDEQPLSRGTIRPSGLAPVVGPRRNAALDLAGVGGGRGDRNLGAR